MTELTTRKDNDVICDCTGTSYQKVYQLINDGKGSLDQISDATGACTGCGSCDILVMEVIDSMAKKSN